MELEELERDQHQYLLLARMDEDLRLDVPSPDEWGIEHPEKNQPSDSSCLARRTPGG